MAAVLFQTELPPRCKMADPPAAWDTALGLHVERTPNHRVPKRWVVISATV